MSKRTKSPSAAALKAALSAPATIGHNLPTLDFGEEIIERWLHEQANKHHASRFEALKKAAKAIAGVGTEITWHQQHDGQVYHIRLVLVTKNVTGICSGCPGQQGQRVEQHFKIEPMGDV